VLCEGFAEYMSRIGVAPSKVRVLSDWIDTTAIRPDVVGSPFRRRHAIPVADCLVVHSGNIGAKQGLETLVEAARALAPRPGISVAIVGDGAARSALFECAARVAVSNLRFLPVEPKETFPEVLAAADILVLHQRDAAVETVIPGKLLAYMASGRSIVAGVNRMSESAKVIERADCGIRVDAERPAALAEAILALDGDVERRRALGENGRRFVEQHFAREVVLPRLEQLLLQVVSAARARL
jgi:colanic acid biosynthesis glycosyl transferase WcaI